jgi:hypothetical protein
VVEHGVVDTMQPQRQREQYDGEQPEWPSGIP